jgi:hypothetical protein
MAAQTIEDEEEGDEGDGTEEEEDADEGGIHSFAHRAIDPTLRTLTEEDEDEDYDSDENETSVEEDFRRPPVKRSSSKSHQSHRRLNSKTGKSSRRSSATKMSVQSNDISFSFHFSEVRIPYNMSYLEAILLGFRGNRDMCTIFFRIQPFGRNELKILFFFILNV